MMRVVVGLPFKASRQAQITTRFWSIRLGKSRNFYLHFCTLSVIVVIEEENRGNKARSQSNNIVSREMPFQGGASLGLCAFFQGLLALPVDKGHLWPSRNPGNPGQNAS
jgi:hypothetical protein